MSFTAFLIILALVITVLFFARFGIIKLIQESCREAFKITEPTVEEKKVSRDYLKIKEHAKNYPFGILPAEGKHYRFERGGAIHRYFAYTKDYAYLIDLLPKRDSSEYEKYFYVPIPQTTAEAETLRKHLASRKIPVILDDTETAALVQKDFHVNVRMNWFQKWIWDNANVYVYWNSVTEFVTMRPHFKKIHFSLLIQDKEGEPLKLEERSELSMNHVAKYVSYAKMVSQIKDSQGIEITIELIISGSCENPFYADMTFPDVFSQNDFNIRNAVVKIASGLSYLPNPENLVKMNKRFESFVLALQQGKVSEEPESEPQQPSKEDVIADHKARIAQEFQQQLVAEMNSAERYTGFVWGMPNINAIYPSGKDAAVIIQKENDLAEAVLQARADEVRIPVEMGQGLAKNAVEFDNRRKIIETDALKISREGEEQAKAIKAVAAEEKARVSGYYKTLVNELGRDGAIRVLELQAKYAAVGKDGTQIFMGLNPTEALGPQINKIILDNKT